MIEQVDLSNMHVQFWGLLSHSHASLHTRASYILLFDAVLFQVHTRFVILHSNSRVCDK